MSSEPSPPTTTLTASCLCKRHTFTAPIRTTDLPLPSIYCHCTSCRHLTGALHSSDIPWPGPATTIPTAKPSLSTYQCTPKTQLLFCGQCGSPMFFVSKTPADGNTDDTTVIEILTGALPNFPAKPVLLRIATHNWVGDTKDGGATIWLKTPARGDPKPEIWAGRYRESEDLSPHTFTPVAGTAPGVDSHEGTEVDQIPLYCKCRGVDLLLDRGAQRRDYRETGEDGGEELPWFIDHRQPTKLPRSQLCACDSCRAGSGTDTVVWTWAELKHIKTSDGRPWFDRAIDLKAAVKAPRSAKWLSAASAEKVGTLSVYTSATGESRFFCGRCSASVFYFAEDDVGVDMWHSGDDPEVRKRAIVSNELVRIAVGCLDAPEGARAEKTVGSAVDWPFFGWEDGCEGWRFGMMMGVKDDMERYIGRTEEGR